MASILMKVHLSIVYLHQEKEEKNTSVQKCSQTSVSYSVDVKHCFTVMNSETIASLGLRLQLLPLIGLNDSNAFIDSQYISLLSIDSNWS